MQQTELFFYNRKDQVVQDGKEVDIWFRDSFNMNTVIRTAQLKKDDEEALVVFLNDIHEEMRMVPVRKIIGKVEKVTQETRKTPVQTQLLIEDPEDIKKFYSKYDS